MNKVFGTIVLASMVGLFSCQEDEGLTTESSDAEIVAEDANAATTVGALFEDIDETVDFGSASIGNDGARFLHIGNEDMDRFGECATVTYDEESSTVTIDFGDEGTVCRDGRLRKGKLHFTHTGTKGELGEKRTLAFDGFEVDSIGFEGVRTLENISDPDGSDHVIAITMTGGKITFPDDTFITYESDKTRTIALNDENEKFEARVFGTASGLNKEGLTYSYTVAEATPLLYSRACRELAKLSPVSGILLIQIEEESDITIDFGDGTCDNKATITKDGVSEEIEINPRQRRMKHHRRGR